MLSCNRYYTVQYRGDSSLPWQTVNERVEPTVTSYTVHGLKPFTAYQFRIQVILHAYATKCRNLHSTICFYSHRLIMTLGQAAGAPSLK